MRAKASSKPLAYLLLAAAALAPTVSCGGSSTRDGASGSGGTGGTGGTGAPVEIGSCESPMPVGDSGWVGCDTGILHRETAGSCRLPDPMTPVACGDCFGAQNPWCLPYGFATSLCVPGCAGDADCAAGEVCFCQGSDPGRCVAAGCTVDADCGEGSLCATVEGPPQAACSYFITGVACQQADDQCAGNECNCVLKNGRRECQEGLGGCGPS
jgi:hypothetical protein